MRPSEKALKSFLGWRDHPTPRTHNLPALLSQCESLEPAFVECQVAARTLDIYLTAGRYPGSGPEPTTLLAWLRSQGLRIRGRVAE